MPRAANQNKSLPIYGHPTLGLQKPVAPYAYVQDSFLGSGLDLHARWPAQDPETLLAAQNLLVSQTGAFIPRPGFATFSKASVFSAGPNVGFSRLFSYQNAATNTGRIVALSATGTVSLCSLKEDGTVANANIFGASAFSTNANCRMTVSRNRAFFMQGTGTSFKWDGGDASIPTKLGIATQGASATIADGGAGNITLQFGRTYYICFRNSGTGGLSDPFWTTNPAFTMSFGPCTSRQASFTGIPVSADAQVDSRLILATADGGDSSVLYQVGIISDNTTTTFTDNTSEATLLTNPVYQDVDSNGNVHGCGFNTRPLTTLNYLIKHKGRLWAIDTGARNFVYFSKSLDDVTTADGTVAGLYEECWPADNFFDVSQEAEVINALISDGETLYIGTNKHIRRITGDSPDNFSEPDILFSNVGVRSDDAWTMVYVDGAPAGMVWLTPEGKLMGSDLNTYQNIGLPVQDAGNGINTGSAPVLANCPTTAGQLKYINFGSYDLVFVALGAQTNGSWLAYDLRTRQWHQWATAASAQEADMTLPAPFFVHWGAGTTPLLIGITDQYLAKIDFANWPSSDGYYTVTSPRTVSAVWTPATGSLAVNVATTWLDLGDGNLVKSINALNLMGTITMNVQINAINNETDLAIGGINIGSFVPSAVTAQSIYSVRPAGYPMKYRYYQFVFSMNAASNFSNSNPPKSFLGAFRVDVVPIGRM